jgi:NAD(P)-dependent dehydrogenase (short-subunit alcohol dehydrogenase family)
MSWSISTSTLSFHPVIDHTTIVTMNASLSAQDWTRREIGKAIVASRSIRREEIPEDLIGTLIYLASPDSDFVTGQTIVVDGGGAMH